MVHTPSRDRLVKSVDSLSHLAFGSPIANRALKISTIGSLH